MRCPICRKFFWLSADQLNMKCLPRTVPLVSHLIYNRIIMSIHNLPLPTQPHLKPLHSTPPESPKCESKIITTICDSLRKGFNWNTLTRNFSFHGLNSNSQIIQKVLLQLKQPHDAKRALGFFHWSAQHIKHDPITYCITIHILVRAKLVKDAQALLESVLGKSDSGISVIELLMSTYEITDSTPFVFDLFVQCCAKLRMIDDAVNACFYLDEHGFKLSIISYNTLIHVVQKSDKTHLVWKIYEHMISKRTYPNDVTLRHMVSALCKEGKLPRFVDIVRRIHGKKCLAGVVVNTCFILGMLEEGKIDEGLVLLKWMLRKNMILDAIACALIVFAKVKLGDLESAWEVYEEMLKRGFNTNSFVHTLFIGAYCEKGRIEEAVRLFREMEHVGVKPNDETFNHLILGCSEEGKLDESLSFCENMIDVGFVPSCLAFNGIVERLCHNGNSKRANDMLTCLLDNGFVPDENTYSHLIAGYGKEGDLQGVLKLYYEMEYKSVSPNYSVFASVIATLCQSRKPEEADKYMMIMKDRSLAPTPYIYENLIVGHVAKGNKTRGHQLYCEMVASGLEANSKTCMVLKT